MNMGRPRKLRRVCFCPKTDFFKPRGIPLRSIEVSTLSSDEVEVLRLIDVEGLDQAGAAERIGVSRITIQRIYQSARRKVADAIIFGKAIKLERQDFVNYCRCPRGRRCSCQNNIENRGE